VDTADGLDLVRSVFTEWIDDEVDFASPALSLLFDPVGDKPARRGSRQLPQLRFGSGLVARGRDHVSVIAALAEFLGSVHAGFSRSDTPWVELRVFERGDAAVLAALDRPALVASPAFRRAGVREAPVWGVAVLDDEVVGLPPALPRLRWSGLGAAEPVPSDWRHRRLAGVVLAGPPVSTPGGRLVALTRQGGNRAWFGSAVRLVEAGDLIESDDRTVIRDHIVRLLSEA
jgi:hypothetical protein